MAKLPTQEQLEALYHEKGHDALVWYAWRNALRALPTLGHVSIREVWAENTVRHVMAVCRVSLILAQWKNTSYADYDYASAANYAAVNYAANYGYADYVSIAASAAASVASAALASVSASTSAAFTTAIAASASASAPIDDYNLLKKNHLLSPQWWCSQPLWHSQDATSVGSELSIIKKWRLAFDKQLRELGLDFLADDLNNLWENKPLGAHAINYLKDISDAELNDPVALRRIILEGEGESIHAVRVLLLGPGGAGKSSLADRLQGKPVDSVKKLTPGVDYLNHQPLNLYTTFSYLHQDKPLDLYLWDFGGQTIFHGLHSAFLHENCVYVLVVDSRHEQAPDEWLHQIRHLTGGRTKVLLVTNWYEGCETRQNETRLLREFPDILDINSFFYFSCHEPNNPNFQVFVQALEKASLDSQRMVLKETLAVHDALKQHYQQDIFLYYTDLENVIEAVTGRPEALETLPTKLEQLGFLVRVDSDDQHYCLKPTWAVDNAYAILYSPLLRKAKGVVKLKDLQREFKQLIKSEHLAYLIEFLQMRSLCCKLGDNGYFFPDAAPADEAEDANKLLQETAKGLRIRFDLPYLPLGFHARLIKKLFKSPDGIKNEQDIWRQGFILRRGENSVVVHYLTRKSIVELVLDGSNWQDLSELMSTLLVNLKAVLLEGQGMREEQIVPSVVLNQQVFSVHSAETLVEVLGQIKNYGQLIQEVKKMASNTTNNYGDVTNNTGGDGSNFATKSEKFTQNSHVQAIEVTSDQRQQIALIVKELLKDAGNMTAEQLLAVSKVKTALEDKSDKPESRSLLGKIRDGLSGLEDVTSKTGSIIEKGQPILDLFTKVASMFPS